MKRRYADESRSVVDAVIGTVKANYKELAGESLTVKAKETSENLEIVNCNVHSPRRTAYFRSKTVYEIG